MVARTHPDRGGLVIAFYRIDAPVEEISARAGVHAWEHAIHLIVKREALQAGDVLIVRRASEHVVVDLGDCVLVAEREAWEEHRQAGTWGGPVMKHNYVIRHWRGELSLPVSYWVNTVLVGIVMTIIDYTVPPQFVAVFATVGLVIFGWSVVGAWRSASRWESERDNNWGSIAKIALFFGVLRTVIELVKAFSS